MLDKKCQCQGMNKTCCHCGGWGYLDSIGEARSSAGAVGLTKSKNKKSPCRVSNTKKVTLRHPIELKCALCGNTVDSLENHKCVKL